MAGAGAASTDGARMSAEITRRDYPSREALAEALAGGVAAVLAGGIATNGRATLAVAGGTTPGLFFERLSNEPIEWRAVTVMPVDERLVHPDHERSNARLIREHLLVGRAAKARFAGMGERAGRLAFPDDASLALEGVTAIDAVILGMGADGHTASFFPRGDALEEATDPAASVPVMPIRTPDQPEARATLTMPWIAGARLLALHIEGAEKRAVLERVLEGEDLPMGRVIRHAPKLEVFWTG